MENRNARGEDRTVRGQSALRDSIVDLKTGIVNRNPHDCEESQGEAKSTTITPWTAAPSCGIIPLLSGPADVGTRDLHLAQV
jgi:hypothetical protein